MGKGIPTALAFVKDEDRANRLKPLVESADNLETSLWPVFYISHTKTSLYSGENAFCSDWSAEKEKNGM